MTSWLGYQPSFHSSPPLQKSNSSSAPSSWTFNARGVKKWRISTEADHNGFTGPQLEVTGSLSIRVGSDDLERRSYTVRPRTTKFDMVTRVWEEHVSRESATPIPRRQGPSERSPNFLEPPTTRTRYNKWQPNFAGRSN